MKLIKSENFLTIRISFNELNNLNKLIFQVVEILNSIGTEAYKQICKDLEKPLIDMKAILNASVYD